MFRKPKKKVNKAGMRRKKPSADENEDDDNNITSPMTSERQNKNNNDDDTETLDLVSQARKRTKFTTTSTSTSTTSNKNNNNVVHQYEAGTNNNGANKYDDNMATRSAEYHPTVKEPQETTQSSSNDATTAANNSIIGKDADGIFRGDKKTRNGLLAGPIRAMTTIRTTCRFDYQPDICKDYKETGFCGFGDTCIYLHDRGDTLSGWQIEQQYENEQQRKKQQQEKDISGFLDMHNNNKGNNNKNQQENDNDKTNNKDDGIPFACYLCRHHFTNPVVTPACNHYFCESCIMDHIRQQTTGKNTMSCPICGQDTYGTFQYPTKLISKKRRILGVVASKSPNSWKAFHDYFV